MSDAKLADGLTSGGEGVGADARVPPGTPLPDERRARIRAAFAIFDPDNTGTVPEECVHVARTPSFHFVCALAWGRCEARVAAPRPRRVAPRRTAACKQRRRGAPVVTRGVQGGAHAAAVLGHLCV
ncbi:hypothetical protein EON68_00105 [archaeon]|nr:MAG: hypothetical protein EON68_00105 [archaeon]